MMNSLNSIKTFNSVTSFYADKFEISKKASNIMSSVGQKTPEQIKNDRFERMTQKLQQNTKSEKGFKLGNEKGFKEMLFGKLDNFFKNPPVIE